MEFKDFKKDLLKRTVDILENYKDEYEATLLINCLTALLVLPRERFFNNIPDKDIQELSEWGLAKEHIVKVRCEACGYNLRNIVKEMRNSVAHIDIDTASENGVVKLVKFQKCGKLVVEIPVEKLKKFVIKLAQSVTRKDLAGTAHPTN